MTQKDKELLLKDLCARLPYGVKAKANDISVVTINGIVKRQSLTGHFDYDIITNNSNFYLKEVKPYLRPMSSVTEKEKKELEDKGLAWDMNCGKFCFLEGQDLYDWFDANHFDYRGLIDKELAIEVTEENNPYKD